MRKTGLCTKCQNNQLLHVGAVADTGEWDTEIRPMELAILFQGTGFFGDEKRTRAGRLSAVVCKKCGYTEFYVLDPQSIVPDNKYVTEIVGPSGGGPHR